MEHISLVIRNMIRYLIWIITKLFKCRKNIHDWYIIGSLRDNNNYQQLTPMVVECSVCGKVEYTVNFWFSGMIEFKNFSEFEKYTKRLKYTFERL